MREREDEWKARLQQDPVGAVTDLMSGRYGGENGLDAWQYVLYRIEPNSEAMSKIGEGVAGWLKMTRANEASEKRKLTGPVYTWRICQAMIMANMSDLAKVRELVTEDLEDWLEWLRELRIAPSRDPEPECLGMLTIGQTDDRYAERWRAMQADGRVLHTQIGRTGEKRMREALSAAAEG